MSKRSLVAALALPLLVLAGCSGDGDQTDAGASSGQLNEACAATDAQLVAADAQPGEPTLSVPQLPGWERTTMMDSEIIRLALVNEGLVADEFAPNFVVTAEPSPADVEQAFQLQLDGIGRATGEPAPEPVRGEVCGHPAQTVEYQLPAMGEVPERPGTVQIIVVPGEEQSTTFTLTAQATESVDPAYSDEVATMMEGIQITD